MMKSDDYEMFVIWCRHLYDSNCKERREHGQEPYEHFEDYYHLHLKWLEDKYNNEETRTKL